MPTFLPLITMLKIRLMFSSLAVVIEPFITKYYITASSVGQVDNFPNDTYLIKSKQVMIFVLTYSTMVLMPTWVQKGQIRLI